MTSSPPCLASSAMAPSSAWIATAACSSDGGLVVMRCSPQAGRGQQCQERSAAFGGEPDQFVAQAGDQRQQQRCGSASFAAKLGDRNQHVDDHRNQHDHEQETGAAARMPGDELLRVLHGDRLAGFEIEDHFVLRAVIFENAADVLRAREQEQESQEDGQADQAIDQLKAIWPLSAGYQLPSYR